MTPAPMASTYADPDGLASRLAGPTGCRPGFVPTTTTQQRRTGASLRLRCRSGLIPDMHADLAGRLSSTPDKQSPALTLTMAPCPAAGELCLKTQANA